MAERDLGFDEWFVHAYPRVKAAVSLSVGDANLAEEATAEAFSRALLHWSKLQGSRSPNGWVYTVAMNQVRSTLRRRRVERRWLRRQPDPSSQQHAAPSEPDDPLWQAVRQLPRRARTAVALRYIADMSEQEVADAMGIAIGTVKATLHQARKRLAQDLAKDNEQERTP